MNTTLLSNLYKNTNGGLEIITELFPNIGDSVNNPKKAFRLRSDERTPSAYLYPPKDGEDCWHVKDYGMVDGGGYFSPIDLYMWVHGYGKGDFRMALEELAERYGVQETLSKSVNKPVIETRDASEEEKGSAPKVELCEGFGNVDLSCWGTGVKSEHLETYGWYVVKEVRIVYGNKVCIRKPTDTYPIFAQKCCYTDWQGQLQAFYKVYEPKNPEKAHRFLISGKKPKDGNYIYGLDAVRKVYNEGGEKKLPVLLIVSGGSDAISALSAGYYAVWLDSEVKGLSEYDFGILRKYAERIVNIPDIDTTGIRAGQRMALEHLDIFTAWMTKEDMGGLHDERGRERKDLRDFRHLHPSKKDMDRLVARAKSARFWSVVTDKEGNSTYLISPSRLNYYLGLNGYFTLNDDTRKDPIYIQVNGLKVKRVVAKSISNFILKKAEQDGFSEALISKLMRCRDLPTDHISHLEERGDINFVNCSETSQRFFFRNGWVEVTADGIVLYRYSDLKGSYVWEDCIVPHDYSEMPSFFSIEKTNMGYSVNVAEDQPSKLFQFVINSSRLHWRKEEEFCQELTEAERVEEHQCLASKIACIGYLLLGNKSESEAWAPICQDSKLAESEDECNGGSGKSVFLKAVGSLKNYFYIDAHNPSVTENRFLFDGVTADTDIIIVDECDRRLNFDFFFGRITGDLKGEEKGNHPFTLPFAKSPKFAFATNYVLKKHDASTERRIWPQVFSDFYHEKTKHNDYKESRSIRDDIGCNLMGTDYSEKDWQADISFMLQCVRFYLSLPKEERRVMPPMNRIEHREQMASVGMEFKQWADEYFSEDSGNLDREIRADDVLNAFNIETKYNWSPKKLTQHLKDYCIMSEHIHCLNPASITGKAIDGERIMHRENGRQLAYYYLMSERQYLANEKRMPEQQELQF